MARIRKGKPKPHLVIPDTSAIWHEDKQYVVDPAFDAFWQQYAGKFGLELVLTEVVRGELLFQQTISAIKGLRRANQAIEEVQKVTRCKYRHRITESRIHQEVEHKFNRWVDSKSATVISTPTNIIIWPDAIKKAIWREPPFALDPQNPDTEKGFRDFLILETVRHFCSQDTRDISIAFLCKDKLLRETAESALVTDKRFSAYELLTDFKTYLDLTNEKLEDAFIKAIVRRASDKFFVKADPECLYFRDNVQGKLQEKYKKYFENPEESVDAFLGLLLPSGLRMWEARDTGSFWISRSQFVKADEEGQYVWLSTVTYVRQYSRPELATGLLGERSEKKEHRILILPFFITWRARVTSDGRFWEYAYVNDELKGNQFRVPTEEDRKDWSLEETAS